AADAHARDTPQERRDRSAAGHAEARYARGDRLRAARRDHAVRARGDNQESSVGRVLTRRLNPKGEKAMDKKLMEAGIKVRREVLGDEYVDRSMKNADEFNKPFQ